MLISSTSAGEPQSFFLSCTYHGCCLPLYDAHHNLSYISSRIFLHDPPGENNAFTLHPNAPEALKEQERKLEEEEPEANSWVCLGVIVITIALMAVTAEFLVESIESVREAGTITEECVQRC